MIENAFPFLRVVVKREHGEKREVIIVLTSELKAGSLQRRCERMERSKGKKINFKISQYCYSPIIFFSYLLCTC